MKTKRQTPKQSIPLTERPLDSKDFADIFDARAKRNREERNSFAYRQGNPELKATCDRWRPFVEGLRNIAIENLKDCPTLPDVPALIGDDYFGWMIHLEDYCRNCAKILRGKRASHKQDDSPKWTQPLSAPKWAKMFGNVNPKTMRQWLKMQKIENDQISPRKWRIAFSALPADVYEKYAKSNVNIISV